jgi:putative oxidoreductase
MANVVATRPEKMPHPPETRVRERSTEWTRFLVPLGRLLFTAIFILSSLDLFSSRAVGYTAAAGVPAANLLVPLAGILALVGGVSVLLGYHARVGALLLVLFLLPVTLWMHRFWAVADPGAAQHQVTNFLKNTAMLGAALMLIYYGAGPLSLDAKRGR